MTMTDQELLDRLRDSFAAAFVGDTTDDEPRPSVELLAWMERGGAGEDPTDEVAAARSRRTARTARPRSRRAAVLVAATVGLVACSLAAAGALPAPLQRGVADLVHHVGIDLPTPAGDPSGRATDPTPEPAPVDPTEPVGTLAPPSTPAPTPTLPGPLPSVTSAPVPTAPVTAPPLPTLPTLPGPLSPGPTVDTLLPSGSDSLLPPIPGLPPLPTLPNPFTLLP